MLSVNGEPYRRDVPSKGGPEFVSVQQEWIPDKPGTYTLQVQGYDLQGKPGGPASVSVEVLGGTAMAVKPLPVISVTPVFTKTPTAVISVTPVISITPPPPQASTINFYAKPADIAAGACTTLYWNVENARQVIFGGIDQSFNGSYKDCLCSTQRYTLTVVNLDGTKKQQTVDVNVKGTCHTVTVPPPAEEEQPAEEVKPVKDTTAPPVPSPAVPANGLELSCRSSQTLAWIPVKDDSSGISGYYVKLERQVKKGAWQSAAGYGPVTDKQVSANVECGGIYRWMVRAQDGAGNISNWSAPSTFSIVLN